MKHFLILALLFSINASFASESKNEPWFDLDEVSESKFISQKKAKKFWTNLMRGTGKHDYYKGFKEGRNGLVNAEKVAVRHDYRKLKVRNGSYPLKNCRVENSGTMRLIKKSLDEKKHLLYYTKASAKKHTGTRCLSGFLVAPASYFDSL